MFICDQGVLPPPHLPSEELKRKVKSRDQYGPVLKRVAEAKKAAAALAAAAVNDPMNVDGVAAGGAVVTGSGAVVDGVESAVNNVADGQQASQVRKLFEFFTSFY